MRELFRKSISELENVIENLNIPKEDTIKWIMQNSNLMDNEDLLLELERDYIFFIKNSFLIHIKVAFIGVVFLIISSNRNLEFEIGFIQFLLFVLIVWGLISVSIDFIRKTSLFLTKSNFFLDANKNFYCLLASIGALVLFILMGGFVYFYNLVYSNNSFAVSSIYGWLIIVILIIPLVNDFICKLIFKIRLHYIKYLFLNSHS